MTTLNEQAHVAEFLLSEAALYRSREMVSIASGQGKLVPGTVLLKSAVAGAGSLTATAKGGNTGNGVFTADVTNPVGVGARDGTYVVTATVAGTNSATFSVASPNGEQLGTFSYSGSGAVGSFNNQIKFTITDGSADFVVGDAFNVLVNVAAGVDTYTATANGGNGDAILYGYVDATSAAQKATAITNDAEVHGELLTFAASATDTQKRDMAGSLFQRSRIKVRWTSQPTG